MSHRLRTLLFLLLTAVLLTAGCESQTPPPTQPPPKPANAVQPPGGEDAAGDPMLGPDDPAPVIDPKSSARRVVAYAPSLVEFIFAMGEENRLVGCSAMCNYPPKAQMLPVLGSAVQPDLEKILAAKPDLILGIGQSQKLVDLAQGNNFRVEPLSIESLEDVLQAPTRIAGLLGAPNAGKGLAARLRGDIDALRKICAGAKTKPRVLVFTGDGGDRFTIGRGAFLTDIVELAGGDCITKNLAKPWTTIDLELLVKSNPDVIIMLRAEETLTAEKRADLIKQWDAYPEFPAVKNRRVVVLHGSHLQIGGPRIVVTALQIAQTLHPELFPAEAQIPATLPSGHPGTQPAPAAPANK